MFITAGVKRYSLHESSAKDGTENFVARISLQECMYGYAGIITREVLLMKKEVFKQLPDTEYGVFWVIRMKKGVVTKIEVYPY